MLEFLRRLAADWRDKHIAREAAALAYYAVFSLPGILLLILMLLSLALEADGARNVLFGELRRLLGRDVTEVLQIAVSRTGKAPSAHPAVATAGASLIVLSALGFYAQLRGAVRNILGEHARESRNWMQRAASFSVSFILLSAVAFLLAASVVTSTLVDALAHTASRLLQVPPVLLSAANSLITTVSLTALFSILYGALSGPGRRWSAVVGSAFVAAVLLMLGKSLVAVFFAYSNIRAQYGISASVLILLFWLYYAANAVLLGAEVLHVLTPVPRRRKIAKK